MHALLPGQSTEYCYLCLLEIKSFYEVTLDREGEMLLHLTSTICSAKLHLFDLSLFYFKNNVPAKAMKFLSKGNIINIVSELSAK